MDHKDAEIGRLTHALADAMRLNAEVLAELKAMREMLNDLVVIGSRFEFTDIGRVRATS